MEFSVCMLAAWIALCVAGTPFNPSGACRRYLVCERGWSTVVDKSSFHRTFQRYIKQLVYRGWKVAEWQDVSPQ